jgi:NitT/TauT family transport system substrate-binding protein
MTITRRAFHATVGAIGLMGAAGITRADATRIYKVVNPNGAIDATQCFSTCGADPRLGYYAAEGVRREQFTVSNLTQGMVAIAQSQADMGSLSPPVFLPVLARQPDLGIVAVYNWLPRATSTIVVPRDSGVKSLADLVDKRIGVRALGDNAETTMKMVLSDLGLPMDKFQVVAIGDVGMAGTALSQKSVDAMVTYDTVAGRIETLGFPLRALPLSKSFLQGAAVWYGVHADAIKTDRKHLVGVLRGTAKSTLFAYNNLAAAIRLHWSLFPESRPKSKSEADALKALEVVMRDRRNAWMRRPDDPEQRMGATSAGDWAASKDFAVKTAANAAAVKQLEARQAFTNELIDEVNDFDKAAIIRQAREFRT